MKCPHCNDPTLVLSERSGIEIDYCPECRGIWLDRGELDKILAHGRQPEPSHKPEDAYQSRSQPSYEQKPYKRKKSFLEELFD